MRFPKCLVLALFLPALAGCWSHTRADPQDVGTPTPLAADAWPKRDPDAVRPLLEATPREVYSYKVIDGVDPTTLSEDERDSVEKPEYIVTYKGLQANGLLRIFEEQRDEKSDITVTVHGRGTQKVTFSDVMNGLILGFTPNAHLMSSRTLESAARRADLLAKLEPPPDPTEASLSVVRGKMPAPKIEVVEATHKLHLEYGLPIRIPPVRPDGKKPSGLIIHLHAIAGNPYEPQVMDELRNRGWAVIDIKTETEIQSPIPESTYAEIVKLETENRALGRELYAPVVDPKHPEKLEDYKSIRKRAEASPLYERQQEISKRLSLLRHGSFQVRSEGDLAGVAQAIAKEVDDGLAGAAYATQAVLDYVKQERPDLQNIPVVLMGFSAGALATPTAAARVHDQIDAVVLIGGGCDLLRISQNSVFTDGGLKIYNGEQKVSKATFEKLDDLYLKYSKLDPYHTAPLITDVPILQLHASTDTWVPYETGELLYERLNRPERLTMHGGHEYLFYFLPGRKVWIADWVEKTVAAHPRKS
jgi:dienelactone hydrolase